MPKQNKKLRVAMPAWEIGRAGSGLGVKIGGLGVIVEELPPELVKAAKKQNIDLEIENPYRYIDLEVLTPILPSSHRSYPFHPPHARL